MKKPLFKASLLLSATILIVLIVFSCNKQPITSELQTKQLTKTAVAAAGDNPFKKTVGAPIDVQVGKRWIENYNRANGTTISTLYVIQTADLQAIFSDTSCVGISFHYALDENNQMHILPIGVNTSGKLMPSSSINTMNGRIDWETAQQWIANDRGPIDSRFFGKNIFDQLFSQPCTAIWTISALDDENNSQLLLSRKQEGDIAPLYQDSFADASYPCPSTCP